MQSQTLRAPKDMGEYATNTYGGPQADPERVTEQNITAFSGDAVRAAATLRENDGDFNQAGDLVRNVLDDAARDRLVGNIAGHVMAVTDDQLLPRIFQYWRNVDAELGARVESVVTATRAERQ